MARSSQEDPVKVFRFAVEMGGARTGFTECTGLNVETEVSEYREGGDNTSPKKSPGQSKFGDVTLKRGQILDEGAGDFHNWAKQVHDVQGNGKASTDFRREVDIVQYGRDKQVVRRWRLYEAWPRSYKPMGDLSGSSNDNSVEELVIVHEGFESVTP